MLLTAAATIHSGPGIFQRAGQFPAAESIDFPLSDEAQCFYKSGRPFLRQYLPFWLAIFVERAILTLIPLVAVMYPLFKILPSLYDWLMHSKIERHYADMKTVDGMLESDARAAGAKASDAELDLLERRASRSLPASYGSSLYTLRSHIAFIRYRFKL